MATIGDLSNGENVGAILTCKIVMHLEKHSEVPMTALIVDSAHNFCVASFYGTNKAFTEKVRAGDLLYIKNPQLIFTSLEFKQRMYSYQCVKIADVMDVLVNDGQCLTDVGASNMVVSSGAPVAE